MTKHGFGKLVSLPEAKKILFSLVEQTSDEEIEIRECFGRIIAKDIKSEIDVPHFEKSAMDGFAVIAKDTFEASQINPRKLKIIDSITAGIVSDKELKESCCIEITTGAPLPKGADAVLMVEYTEKENDTIKIYKAVAPNENIIKMGSDVKKGKIVVKKSERLNHQNIGVLSAVGINKVDVKKKPVVAYFSSGNEIVEVDKKLSIGKIYDINTLTITSALKESGCDVVDLGLVDDELEKIKERIKQGLDISDMVILSGGSSLGDEDFMVDAVKQLGEVLVHGIAVKPGKPTLIGKVDEKLVLGLPGYPTSALSNFYILVKPLINKMLGVSEELVFVEKKLSRKIASTIGRYEFLAVKISGDFAEPVMKGSSSITTLADADGFIEIDENTEVINKDDKVRVRLF